MRLYRHIKTGAEIRTESEIKATGWEEVREESLPVSSVKEEEVQKKAPRKRAAKK